MPEPVAAFFCDEVRQEHNGKLLIIGTYTGQMVVPSFPYTAKVQPVAVLKGNHEQVRKLSVKVSGARGATFAEGEFEFESDEGGGSNAPFAHLLPLPPTIITLSGPEQIELYVGLNDAEAAMIGSIWVVQAPTADQPVDA